MRATDLYHHDRATWKRVMINGMKQDWSWDRCAAEYEELYRRLTS